MLVWPNHPRAVTPMFLVALQGQSSGAAVSSWSYLASDGGPGVPVRRQPGQRDVECRLVVVDRILNQQGGPVRIADAVFVLFPSVDGPAGQVGDDGRGRRLGGQDGAAQSGRSGRVVVDGDDLAGAGRVAASPDLRP